MTLSFGATEAGWIEPAINIGAVLLGSFLAWITSYYFEIVKRKQDDLARAYSLMFKVQNFANELVQLEREVQLGVKRAELDGMSGPVWTKMVNVIGFRHDSESITADELALVARTKDVDLVMKIRELESGHLIMMSVITKIESLRSQMSEMDLAESVQGRTVTFEAKSQQEHARVAPLIINLGDLSEGLVRDLPRICVEARGLANTLGSKLKKYYKFEHFITLHIPGPTDSSQEG